MGDEHRGDAHRALDGAQLVAHLLAELLVERGERLVEQQHARPVHERAGQGHALLHASRQLGRPLAARAVQPHEIERLADPALDLRRGDAPLAQAEGHVLPDREVREEGVGLEDHAEAAQVRRARR